MNRRCERRKVRRAVLNNACEHSMHRSSRWNVAKVTSYLALTAFPSYFSSIFVVFWISCHLNALIGTSAKMDVIYLKDSLNPLA